MKLHDSAMIVTGGNQGFGLGIVQKLLHEGASVVNVDLTSPPPHEAFLLGASSSAIGERLVCLQSDVTLPQTWQKALAAVDERGWHLAGVVNNAGWTYPAKPTISVTPDEFDKVFSVNVKSFYVSTATVVPYLRDRGRGGAFVTISSTAALRPRPFLTWYNATKGAVSVASKSMALEFAKDQIRFNCICPVAGNTPLLKQFAGGEFTEEKRKMFVESVPLGRLSEPSDIANAVAFLASEEARFITGVDLEVDGGRCV